MNSMQSASRKKEEESSHTIDDENDNYSYAEKNQVDLRESNLDKIIEHSRLVYNIWVNIFIGALLCNDIQDWTKSTTILYSQIH